MFEIKLSFIHSFIPAYTDTQADSGLGDPHTQRKTES